MTDRIATWQHELNRKVDAGRQDLTGELSEGAVLLDVESVTVEEGLSVKRVDRHGQVASATFEIDVDRVLARFGSWYELFPRSWGGFRGVADVLPRARRARLRRRLSPARPPDRLDQPQGSQQHAHAGAG